MFLNSLKKYVETYRPDKTYCCWDEKPERLKNVRNTLNPNYKANRSKETAVEVYEHTEVIKELVSSLGIKNVFPYQYEADDVMCYLATKLPGTKTIITVDKDLFQLVCDNVSVFDPIRKVEVTQRNFETVTGVTIDQFVTLKALKGDKSDNIEGLKGFGEKTVQRYFAGEFELTEEQKQQIELNLRIVDLKRGGVNDDTECNYIAKQLEVVVKPNYDKFVELCTGLGFKSILDKKDKWNELFFFKDQYTSLLETLFT